MRKFFSPISSLKNQLTRTNSKPADSYKKRLIESQQRDVKLEPNGIPNTGNTCYMNALIQVLCWTPALEQKLVVQLILMVDNTNKIPDGITAALFDIIDNIHSGKRLDIGLLKNFLSIIKKHNRQFTGNKQQDCFELFNTIIGAVEDESERVLPSTQKKTNENSQYKATAQSLVTCLFEGTFETQYRYGSCIHEDRKYQSFTSISVPPVPAMTKEKPSPNNHGMSNISQNFVIKGIYPQKANFLSSDKSNEERESNFGDKSLPSTNYDEHCENNGGKIDREEENLEIKHDSEMNISTPSSVIKGVDVQKSQCSSSDESNQENESNIIDNSTLSTKRNESCNIDRKTDTQLKEEPLPENLGMKHGKQSYYREKSVSSTSFAVKSKEPQKSKCSSSDESNEEIESNVIDNSTQSIKHGEYCDTKDGKADIHMKKETLSENLELKHAEQSYDPEMSVSSPSAVAKVIDPRKSICPCSDKLNVENESNGGDNCTLSHKYKQYEIEVTTDTQLKEVSVLDDLLMKHEEQSYNNNNFQEQNGGNDSKLHADSTEDKLGGNNTLRDTRSAPQRAENKCPTVKNEHLHSSQEDAGYITNMKGKSKIKNGEYGQMENNCKCNNLTETGENSLHEDVQYTTTAQHEVGSETHQSNKTELEVGLFLLTDDEVFDEREIGCRECKVGNRTTQKKLLVNFPPPILVLHLNRFEQVNGGMQKINRTITYPDYLDLTPFCSETAQYSLYGVVLHKGTIRKGHYTSYIRTKQTSTDTEKQEVCKGEVTEGRDNWYHADDSKLHHVKKTDVVNSPDAYMLFYHKLN